MRIVAAIVLLIIASTSWAGAVFNRNGKFCFSLEGETVFGADTLIVGLCSGGQAIQWLNEDSVPLVGEKSGGGRIERRYAGCGPIAAIRKSIRDLSPEESEFEYEAEIRKGLPLTHLQLRFCLPESALTAFPSRSPDLLPEDGVFTLSATAGKVSVHVVEAPCVPVLRDFRHKPNDCRGYVWFEPKYDRENGTVLRIKFRVKAFPRDDGAFYTLPLERIATRALADDGVPGNEKGGCTDQGAVDLSFVKAGNVVRSAAIPFRLEHRAVILGGGGKLAFLPGASKDLALDGLKAERLDFLHAVAWAAPRGREAFRYVLTFEDGSTETVGVVSGVNTGDWVGTARVPGARIGLRGRNAAGEVSLYHQMWRNPHPSRGLRSLKVVAGESVPIVLAATALRTGVLQDDISRGYDALFNVPEQREEVDASKWYRCPIAWRDTIEPGSALDVSFLNEGLVAGTKGHVIVNAAGAFAFADEPERAVRFWGTNVGAAGLFPPKRLAGEIARNFARQGVNLVRLHGIATKYYDWLGPHWLIRSDGTIDEDSLDLLFNFTAELKKNGIYLYLDCNDGLWYEALLGRPFRNDERAASQFDPELTGATKRFLRDFLTRKNPYTGLSLAEDPAVAMWEIVNECSLPGLLRHDVTKRLGPYYDHLNTSWRTWRGAHLPAVTGDLADGSDAARVEFLAEVQRRHFADMKTFLRSIGVQGTICGNNNVWTPTDLVVATDTDFTNDHFYLGYSDYANQRAVPVNNECMVRTSSKGFPMSRRINNVKLLGKPVVAGEWNFCFPNDFRSEGLPLCTVFSLLQGHDALLFFCANGAFDCGIWSRFERNPGIMPLSQQTDPSTWGLSQVCAIAFRRGDIAVARRTLLAAYTPQELYGASDPNELIPSKFAAIAGVHRIESAVVAGQAERPTWSEIVGEIPSDRVSSDTGELVRYPEKGLLVVDTTRTKMVVGELNRLDAAIGHLSDMDVSSSSAFGTLAVTSLDGLPIANSRRMLLVLVGNSRNTDTTISDGVMTSWGTGGVVVTEPMQAKVKLSGGALEVHRLDPLTGRRMGTIPASYANGNTVFEICTDVGTPYFELRR